MILSLNKNYSVQEYKYDLINNRDMSLFGAFSSGDKLRFTIEFTDFDPEAAEILIHKDAWNSGNTVYRTITLNKEKARQFTIELSLGSLMSMWDNEPGLFYYQYRVRYQNECLCYGGENPTELIRIKDNIGERQLLIYEAGYRTSQSYSEGVTYHIFVDRFYRSGRSRVKKGAVLNEDWDNGIPQYGEFPGAYVENNVFFGGDLYGITEKLDYIESLGVRTIYLSPVFDAYSNHKYDTGDYLKVDAMFGGNAALVELCKKAKKHGIQIILDGVFNHTGSDSVYFNKKGKYKSVGAYQSEASPYADWYTFRKFPDDYECWWGVKIMPRVNSHNQQFRDFICDKFLSKWMKDGVSGWRLDVADELDNAFLDDFRKAVKKNNPDGVIIGEVWEDATDKVSYGYRRRYLCGGQLDSVMNYPLRKAVISFVKNGEYDDLVRYTEGTYRRYPKCSSDNLMNFLGTHDTERILTLLGGVESGDRTNEELSQIKMTAEERENAVPKLKIAYGIIAGLPGSPSIFYGDEVGIEGYRDPFCRRPFPWHNIDENLLEFYRTIGKIRRENEIFKDGLFRILYVDSNVFIYERTPFDTADSCKIIVAASIGCKLAVKTDMECTELTRNNTNLEFNVENSVIYLKAALDTEISVEKE